LKIVGRYHIQARLGEGAMANVYRAYDPQIQRTLAIKVLKREYCRNPQFADRFLREARAAGALSHPNIVTIYDVGEIEGFPYIAMELLDGEPLDKVAARRGQFPAEEVLKIGRQLADALRYAHDQGVVHRDVKPSNIMLGADGSVKILDFGIARVEQDNAAAGSVRTQVGQVLGTPRYMSPEQALGQELDGRSDLFSVGAVLYELLTARPAFTGASAATLALQITQQPPPPIDVKPECPKGLRFIVEKLLEKRPQKRFQSGAKLLEAIEREQGAFAASQNEDSRRRLPFPARVALIGTAVTTFVLTLGVGFVLNQQYRAMERVAFASGSSIVSFVASNAALQAAENMTLPADQTDWVPTQAFVNTAASDPNVTQMIVADHDGVIRAASSPDLIGARYLPPAGRQLRQERNGISVTPVTSSDGVRSFRFARPIVYAGRSVGLVDVSVRRDELEAAACLSRLMLSGLALLTLAVVAVLSFLAAHLFMRPIRRLHAALREGAAGDLDFRISHTRRDEFGDLFDAFNAMAATAQKRAEASTPRIVTDLNATTIAPANDEYVLDQEVKQW